MQLDFDSLPPLCFPISLRLFDLFTTFMFFPAFFFCCLGEGHLNLGFPRGSYGLNSRDTRLLSLARHWLKDILAYRYMRKN